MLKTQLLNSLIMRRKSIPVFLINELLFAGLLAEMLSALVGHFVWR